jgi:hypothetical protein
LFLNERKTPKALFFHFVLFWKLSGIYFVAINTCLPKSTPSSQSASCCDGYYPYMSIWYPEDALVEFFRTVERKCFFFYSRSCQYKRTKSTPCFASVCICGFASVCIYGFKLYAHMTHYYSHREQTFSAQSSLHSWDYIS